jgi:hypothetical protein
VGQNTNRHRDWDGKGNHLGYTLATRLVDKADCHRMAAEPVGADQYGALVTATAHTISTSSMASGTSTTASWRT